MYVIHMSFAEFLDGFHRIPLAAIVLSCLVAPCRLAVAQGFDLLLQATYTGYYSHPHVLGALGGVESDHEGEQESHGGGVGANQLGHRERDVTGMLRPMLHRR